MTTLDGILKSRDITLLIGPSSQGYRFSSGHVWMWELDCEESWAPNNWFFWTVVLVKTLESPLDCKEIQSVHSKGDKSWVFIGRTDAKAETAILWPPDAKNWLIGKDPDTGRDWVQEENGMTEDEMAGWHHWLYGHAFDWTLEVGDGQGRLACCDSWDCNELDTTERLNCTELILDQVEVTQRIRGLFIICKPISEINHINKLKFKIDMIISIDAGKSFDKI